MRRPREGGIAKTYVTDYDTAFKKALNTCFYVGLNLDEKDQDAKYIVCSSAMDLMSYGERVGIYFEDAGQNQVRIRIVTKTKVWGDFMDTWAGKIHKILQETLTLAKDETPL